jgi:hypothetical protein
LAKPQIEPRALKELEATVKPKVYEAVREGDLEKAASFNVALGAARERRLRPKTAYIMFMAECIKQTAADKSLSGTQSRVKACAQKWRSLKPEDKERYKKLAELKNRELGVGWK